MYVCSRSIRQGAERGQSLVETALFLPILIFMLAGVVEVSNLLITQNRLLTASRMAAGFGATNYVREEWTQAGGTADAMGIVALNTVTQTMPLSPDLWDIYSIRALTNDAGTDFEEFESRHSYGNNAVVAASEWPTLEASIKANMLADLQSTGADSAKNVEVVASVPFHNLDDILGLPVWQWTGLRRANGQTVMRVLPEKEYGACPLLPIAVRLKQFSLYPSNWAAGVKMHDIPGDPVTLFPEGSGPTSWQYPSPAPVYLNSGISASKQLTVTGPSAEFEDNDPGVPLELSIRDDIAHRGNLYWAREAGPGGNFGWLSWDGSKSANDLRASLVIPGNFLEKYPGSRADTNTTGRPPQGMGPPWDPPGTGDGDGWLEYHEWVENATGNIASAVKCKSATDQCIERYVDEGTYVNLVVFDMYNGEIPGTKKLAGAHTAYRVWDLITVRLIGFSLQGPNDTKWILFEFISSGVNCGPNEY